MTSPASGPAPRRPEPARRPDGLLIGRVRGVPITVAPSWLLIAVLITALYTPDVQARLPLLSTAAAAAVAFTFAVLLYVGVLLHELGHTLVALAFGHRVRSISIQLLGGASELDGDPQTPTRELTIAAAGPLVSLGLAALGFASLQFLNEGTVLLVLSAQLAWANLLIGIFNLLPGLPLDGGRVLRALVWGISGSAYRGTVVAAWAGKALAAAMMGAPIVLALLSGRQPDPVTAVWGIILGLFVWRGATDAERVARVRRTLPGLVAGAMARPAVAVSADTSVAEAVRRAHVAGARGVVVVALDGTPTAVVHEASVTAMPVDRRPWVPVSSVARSLAAALVIRGDLEGEALLDAMRASPAPEYVVVAADGAIVGVLSTDDVASALQDA